MKDVRTDNSEIAFLEADQASLYTRVTAERFLMPCVCVC